LFWAIMSLALQVGRQHNAEPCYSGTWCTIY
jgi:hypothetical protein